MIELHLHLFGCLEAKDLWRLGKDLWQERKAALNWYACEFKKACGYTPKWELYWQSEKGYELLKKDFIMSEASSFKVFQAKFNLIIALFPINENDASLINLVYEKCLSQSLKYAELRVPIPPRFNPTQVILWLDLLATSVNNWEKKKTYFTPRIVISLPRENEYLIKQYSLLRKWQSKYQELKYTIVGIDFCGYEEPFPPIGKKEFFRTVKKDNKNAKHYPLTILYHVGESFEKITLASSIRWIWQTHEFGADRLGHAISLGINTQGLINTEYRESIRERRDHLQWLIDQDSRLKKNGFEVKKTSCLKELNELKTKSDNELLEGIYTREMCDELHCLQEAIMKELSTKGAVIEVCPSSNMMIAKLELRKSLTINRFIKASMNIIVSSDDPGIFATNLSNELKLCKQSGLSEFEIAKICSNSQKFNSSRLFIPS